MHVVRAALWSLALAAAMHATPMTFTLVNVTFSNGGVATGHIVYDPQPTIGYGPGLNSWTIDVTGPGFYSFRYRPLHHTNQNQWGSVAVMGAALALNFSAQIVFDAYNPTGGPPLPGYGGRTLRLTMPEFGTGSGPWSVTGIETVYIYGESGRTVTGGMIATVTSLPEPASIAVVGGGLSLFGVLSWRKRALRGRAQ